MISQKPYLINAIYEWCVDNGFTPHLATVVDDNTIVPLEYVQNNQIVLNIDFNAVKNLLVDKEWITFQATFDGIVKDIAIPTGNIIAIYAKENGQGMQFNVETSHVNSKKKPELDNSGLRLVK